MDIKQATASLQLSVSSVVGLAELKDGTYRIDYDGTEAEGDRTTAESLLAALIATPDPDWQGFRSSLVTNTTWVRVLNSSPAAAAAVVAAMWQVGQDPSIINDVKIMWDGTLPLVNPALTSEEIGGLNAIAQANNIPISLNANGEMMIN